MAVHIQDRIGAIDWNQAQESLSARGYAVTHQILSPEECASLISLYNDPARFRSHIIM